MKITHYNNSFISVASQGERMVCDPWVGKANASGWQSFPEFSAKALAVHLADVRWVYLSHLHDDHFHPDTLKSCELLDREFIIKRFQSPVLRERLKRLGVTRIHEVEPFTVNRFGPFDVTIFPQMTSNSSALADDVNYDLDTSIAIKTEGVVFFNQVDNPLSLKDLALIRDHVVEHLGPIDVSCIMSGAASEYPHLFLGIDQASEKRRIVDRSLVDLGEWLSLLKPKYFFPAGGTYLIPGWMSVYNDNIAQPDFVGISSFIAGAGLPVRPFSLEGGHFLELTSTSPEVQMGLDLTPIETDRQAAIEMHRQDGYLHDDMSVPHWPTLALLLDAARENWQQKVSKDGLKIRQSIRFDIYPKLSLSGEAPDISVGVNRYQLFNTAETDTGELIIHIDQRALYGCLTRRLVWNGVLGSLCLYERKPNCHYPTDLFSCNFLALSNEQIGSLNTTG
jgi:L-ascorbate metabolism protein UlaG (beta-lactamase superfamily)